MKNPFVHIELSCDSTKASKEFYGQLFDWKFEETPSALPNVPYTYINVGEGTGGGMIQKQCPQPTAWLAYVLVDNVDITLNKARELGAKVILEKILVPNKGAFAIFSDPEGAVLGIWECLKE